MLSAGRVLIKPEGDYSPLKTYEMLDYVSYNGSSYIAKKTTTGNLPTDTEYWQLSASGAQSQNVTSNFAEVEGSDIASSPHAIDDVFVNKDGKLLKATLDISIGDTIVIDTNCEPTTVEALISYLSTQVSTLDSSNKKLNGITEIAVQTDLHTLSLGEFYKDKTSFYVTNGPEEVDEVASAIFRLTVESALNDLSTTRLLTLKTPGGKVYTQNYDGSSWGDWEQVASESEVGLKQNITDNTLQTTSKTVPGAINELLSKSQTVKEEVDDIVNIYGAKNLLPNNAVSKTVNGVTFTVNSDGSVTANGTASAYTQFDLNSGIEYKEGKYTLNGCPSGGGSSTYVIWVRNLAVTVGVTDKGSGATLNVTNTDTFKASIIVYSGATVNNLVFYPMLRPVSITDDTYVPYSMTNREMTPYVQAISNPNLVDNPWFTVNQRGQNVYTSEGYTVDRWRLSYSAGATTHQVTVNNDNSITIECEGTANTYFRQKSENELLPGDVYTLSIKCRNIIGSPCYQVMFSDGTYGTTHIITEPLHTFVIWDFSKNINGIIFNVHPEESITLEAVKIEKGSVSTLAMDTAPNYATELLKCQRYFVRLNGNQYYGIGMGSGTTNSRIDTVIYLPSAMRAAPTITFAGSFGLYNPVSNIPLDNSCTLVNISLNAIALRFNDTTNQAIVEGKAYKVIFNSANSYIDFSADL